MRRYFKWTAYFLLCLTACGLGTAFAVMQRNPLLWAGFQASGFYPSFLRKPEPFKNRSELFVLILGCDENRYYARPGSGKPGKVVDTFARSDTIQLIRLNFKEKTVGMMQIPRDTYVDVSPYPAGKINGVFAHGGKEATAQVVAHLTGIVPDRVVVLNYEAIEKMIDEVGGVEVFVPKRMYKKDVRGDLYIDLKKGRHLMDGRTALGYLRYRNDSDFDRGSRQQEFMVAFKERVLADGVGMGGVYRLANLAMEIVGGGLTADEFAAIGKFASEVPPSRIKHGMLPIREQSGSSNLIFERADLEKALQECGLRDAPVTPTSTHANSHTH